MIDYLFQDQAAVSYFISKGKLSNRFDGYASIINGSKFQQELYYYRIFLKDGKVVYFNKNSLDEETRTTLISENNKKNVLTKKDFI